MAKTTYHYIGLHSRTGGILQLCMQGSVKADFEDGDDDDVERYKVPDDLAACYTGRTAVNYGVMIHVLKRLTADSLEVFGQVSHRWHKFLHLTGEPSSTLSLKRKTTVDAREPLLLKRPKILPLEKPDLDTGGDRQRYATLFLTSKWVSLLVNWLNTTF